MILRANHWLIKALITELNPSTPDTCYNTVNDTNSSFYFVTKITTSRISRDSSSNSIDGHSSVTCACWLTHVWYSFELAILFELTFNTTISPVNLTPAKMVESETTPFLCAAQKSLPYNLCSIFITSHRLCLLNI